MGPKAAAIGQSASGPKKHNPSPPAPNARSANFLQKRAQVNAARKIPAQPADAALKDGGLDLQAFVAAHEFEIRSLEQSMATSKAVSTSRAFQQVPRGLRRRTASHNPKKVPRRLRARAMKEMKEDNTPKVEARRRKPTTTRARIRAETAKRLGTLAARKRRKKLRQAEDAVIKGSQTKAKESYVAQSKAGPKIRRNVLGPPPKPPAQFRRRQLNKTWLPTHIWHAKRARMTQPKEPLWRFALPLTPNEKVYRPTHRTQGDRGAMVWDTSYMSTIGVFGNTSGLERVLKRIGVSDQSCWNDRGKHWRIGTRSWSGVLSKERGTRRRPIGPATIFWNPESRHDLDAQQMPEKKTHRQVLVRVHPAAFLETFNELLRLTKMEKPALYIEDLRFEIGSITLTGPASTETLMAILTPYSARENLGTRQAHIFKSLASLTNPAMLPPNALLNFSVEDPRLRYPPTRAQANGDPAEDMDLLDLIATWPVEDDLQLNAIFDRNARWKASCLPCQKTIDRRKGINPPGKALQPTTADPPIPITLLVTGSDSRTQIQGSWTLLAPRKCILPFWRSIVRCPLTSGGNPRFGGLNESMQVAFERGLPWFPADFLGTDAGVEWELEQRRRRRSAWDRRPKSRRLEWTSLDLGAGRKGEVGDAHSCDFEYLFGLPGSSADGEKAKDVAAVESHADQALEPQTVKPCPPALTLLECISKVAFNSHLSQSAGTSPFSPHAIVNVRISLLSRGVVTSCARIYRLPSKKSAAISTSSDAEVPATIPPPQPFPASSAPSRLPPNLRSQWLARVPCSRKPSKSTTTSPRARDFVAVDMEGQKRLLAMELTAPPVAFQGSRLANQSSIDGGCHPLVPDAEDMVGFVTTGSFCLSSGRGAAMGCLAVAKVLPDVREHPQEGRLCIVRNIGENVGWIARWDVV